MSTDNTSLIARANLKEAERRKQLEEAAAKMNALRAEIDKILDDMSDGNLAEVLRYLRSFVDDRQAS